MDGQKHFQNQLMYHRLENVSFDSKSRLFQRPNDDVASVDLVLDIQGKQWPVKERIRGDTSAIAQRLYNDFQIVTDFGNRIDLAELVLERVLLDPVEFRGVTIKVREPDLAPSDSWIMKTWRETIYINPDLRSTDIGWKEISTYFNRYAAAPDILGHELGHVAQYRLHGPEIMRELRNETNLPQAIKQSLQFFGSYYGSTNYCEAFAEYQNGLRMGQQRVAEIERWLLQAAAEHGATAEMLRATLEYFRITATSPASYR